MTIDVARGPISGEDMDILVGTLDVDVSLLQRDRLPQGKHLLLDGSGDVGLFCIAGGRGVMTIDGLSPINLSPRSLIIAPHRRRVWIEVPDGSDKPLELVYGEFAATYASTIGLLDRMAAAIIEPFDADDKLDSKLHAAVDEMGVEQVGTSSTRSTLLKQILVMLFRRSMASHALWAERFALFGDPDIVRAFAAMISRPDLPHTIGTLAAIAGIGRSAFIERFSARFYLPPMTVLRKIRMREAAALFLRGQQSVDQVARAVGYTDRTSFWRAFHRAHGCDPSAYRARHVKKGVTERL